MEVDGSPAPADSTNSSGRGTPQISNPGTPRSLADMRNASEASMRDTPPPMPANLSTASPAAGIIPGSSGGTPQPSMQTPGTSAAHRPSPIQQHHAGQPQSKYAQLLAVIEDMGKDIRPTYSGSKTSSERLKRGIVHARILVRECLMECERSARS